MALGVPILKHFRVVKTAKSMDPAEVAHIESPPLDLTCVPSVLSILNMI